MTTIGTIVDLLSDVPDAIGTVEAIVRRLRNARGEDRAALIAHLREVGAGSQGAFEAASDRLRERFPGEP